MYPKIQPRSDNINLNIKITYVQALDGRIIYSYEDNSNCKLWTNLNIRPLVNHEHVKNTSNPRDSLHYDFGKRIPE